MSTDAETKKAHLEELEQARQEGVDAPQKLLEEAIPRGPRGAVRGTTTLHRAKGRPVYLYMRETGDFIECELYDQGYVSSQGKMPAELHMICPYCGGESVIPPTLDITKKTLRIEYLSIPKLLEMPDNGEVVAQTARVSVEEPCMCGHPDPAGKGRCGFRFRLTDNVISRI